jgi:hypothetical protein
MTSISSEQARAYFEGLALANAFEIEELRKTSVEMKLRQLWALMSCAHLFEDVSRGEARARDDVRRRWVRLYKTQGG